MFGVMRRVWLTVVVITALTANGRATEFWQDDQNANGKQLLNLCAGGVDSLTYATNGNGALACASLGAHCTLISGVLDCSGGVTGTAPIFITGSPTTPNVTIQGSIVSGSTSTSAQNIGALSSGVLEATVSAGVATIVSFSSTGTRIPYGSGSNGQLTDSTELTFNDATGMALISDAIAAQVGIETKNTQVSSVAYEGLRMTNDAGHQAYVYQTSSTYNADPSGTNAMSLWCSAGPINLFPAGTQSAIFTDSAGMKLHAIAAPSTPAAGWGTVYVDSTSRNIAVKNDGGTVNHGAQTFTCGANQFHTALNDAGASSCNQPDFTNLSGSANCAQMPALTGGVTSSAGSCATVIHDIASGAIQDGYLEAIEIAAPTAPPGGEARVYVDSTSKNIVCKDDAGHLNHGIRTQAGTTHQFVSAVADDGSSTTAVPDALKETSGPTTLVCGAIPDSNPNSTVLIRPSGASTLVGIDSKTFIGGSGFYTMSFSGKVNTADSTTSFYAPNGGQYVSGEGVSANEYPLNHIFTTATMRVNILDNNGTSGTWKVTLFRNGSATSVTASYGPGTTGVQAAVTAALAGGAASDTFGLVYDGTLLNPGGGATPQNRWFVSVTLQ